MRLFNWYAYQRASYTKSGNLNLTGTPTTPSSDPTTQRNQTVAAMSAAKQIGSLDGKSAFKPELGVYVNSKFLVNGVFTRDTDINRGTNQWIAEKSGGAGAGVSLYGNSFAFINIAGLAVYSNLVAAISFSQYTWQIRDLIRDKIGRDNEPVIIMEGFNSQTDATGHILLSQAYIVHEGWFSANVLAWVRSGSGADGLTESMRKRPRQETLSICEKRKCHRGRPPTVPGGYEPPPVLPLDRPAQRPYLRLDGHRLTVFPASLHPELASPRSIQS